MLGLLSMFMAVTFGPGDFLGGALMHSEPGTIAGEKALKRQAKKERDNQKFFDERFFDNNKKHLKKFNVQNTQRSEKDARQIRAFLRPLFLEMIQLLQKPSEYAPQKSVSPLEWSFPIIPKTRVYRLLLIVKQQRKNLKKLFKEHKKQIEDTVLQLGLTLSEKKQKEKQLLLEATLVLAALNYLETKLVAQWYMQYWMLYGPDAIDEKEYALLHKILKIKRQQSQSIEQYIKMIIEQKERMHHAFMKAFKTSLVSSIKSTVKSLFKHIDVKARWVGTKIKRAIRGAFRVLKKKFIKNFKPKERSQGKLALEKAMTTHEKILDLGIVELPSSVAAPTDLSAMLELRTLQALFEQAVATDPNLKMITFVREQRELTAGRTRMQLELLQKLIALKGMTLSMPELIRVLLPFLSTTQSVSDATLRKQLAAHPSIDKKLQEQGKKQNAQLFQQMLGALVAYQNVSASLPLLPEHRTTPHQHAQREQLAADLAATFTSRARPPIPPPMHIATRGE